MTTPAPHESGNGYWPAWREWSRDERARFLVLEGGYSVHAASVALHTDMMAVYDALGRVGRARLVEMDDIEAMMREYAPEPCRMDLNRCAPVRRPMAA